MKLARSLAVLALLVLTGWVGSPASAEPPINISGPITDDADALTDAEEARVRAALDEYNDRTGFQLFVVYVDSFDDRRGEDWATDTAIESDLGPSDFLLAIATKSRGFGYSVDDDFAISDGDIEKVIADDAIPALRDERWADATIATANGLTKAAESADLPWGAIVVGGVVIAGSGAGGVYLVRRRYDRTHVTRDEHGEPVDPLSTLSTEELDQRCGTALVAMDDGLKSSAQELAFAEAQFGKEATKRFAEVLAEAQQIATSAFALRQRLDDATPESEVEHRRMSAEIIRLAEKSDALLDEQVESFAQLRDLQARAPEVIEDMVGRADEVAQRLPAARATLDVLGQSHTPSDLASVLGNADLAEQLLGQARQQCALGRTALSTDDRASAVVRARAAESAIGQATTLLVAVDRADAELKAAPAQIAARLSSLGADIADAQRLAPQDPAITQATATAQQAVTYAGQGDHDPLAAVRGLQTAEAELDELLGPVRAAAAEAEKARVALNDSLGRIDSRIQAVTSVIATRGGVVGSGARTRLSEAARHLDRARQLAPTDSAQALAESRSADTLVDEADRITQREVREWERAQAPANDGGGFWGGGGGGWGGGGSGGGWSSSRSRSSSRRSSSRRSSSRRSSSRRSSSRRSSSRGRRGGGGRF